MANGKVTFNGKALPSFSRLELDLHGYSQREAKEELDIFLDNAPKGPITVKIIHGYNSGDALQQYIRAKYKHKRISRKILGFNGGSTDFSLN